MKAAILLSTVCLVLAAMPAVQPIERRPEPFVRAGVSYPIALLRDRERAADDLEAIHTLGFNAIRLPIEWADIEPARRDYRFDDVNRMLGLAGRAGLKVVLDLDTEALPEWLLRRYPDGRFVPPSTTDGPRPELACLDHPGVRADVETFVAVVLQRAASPRAWQSIDISAGPDRGFCLCPHTERRFRAWLKETFGTETRPAVLAKSDRAAFVALERRDHLAIVADPVGHGYISSSRVSAPSVIRQLFDEPPGQDDWLMTTAIDHYGTLVPPELAREASLLPAQLGFALDGIRSASRDKGWLMTDRTVAAGGAQVPSAADLRLWTWAAFSRGARGVTYTDWRASGRGASGSLVDPDGTIGDRARAAGALARVIARNPALFAPLRPRPAKIAIVYDPRPPGGGSRAASAAAAFQSIVYQALFERNTQVDFIHLGEIAAGMASRYNVAFVGAVSTLPRATADVLKAYVAAGGTLVDGSMMSLTGEQVVQFAARAGAGPEVRIEGATGPVETRFLESSDVLMLIGLNHSGVPQRVKMTFSADTQEAIWQNMETGAAVNFIAGPEGPTYTYSFGPRDALILMIRKHLR
jgi:glycosyl hydrolase family 42 (putative beta-galactosidase)